MFRLTFQILCISTFFAIADGWVSPSSVFAIDPGPSYLHRPNAMFGSQKVQFMLFLVGAGETDADVDRIVQKRTDDGKTHEANQSYWVSLSQGNDEQLVMAWHDRTYGKYQWIRIRWHPESTRVLQITNDSMSRWRNLSFGDSQHLNYGVGKNKYVLKIQNPSAGGGWDENDIIYSFNVYDR
jgi:hypothetical protein